MTAEISILSLVPIVSEVWDVFCHVKEQKRSAGSGWLFSWCLWVKCDLSNQDFKPHHRLPEEILKWEFMEQTLTLRIPIWADQTTVCRLQVLAMFVVLWKKILRKREQKAMKRTVSFALEICSSEFYVCWSLGISRHVWLFLALCLINLYISQRSKTTGTLLILWLKCCILFSFATLSILHFGILRLFQFL